MRSSISKSEVEETLKRIQSHKGVIGLIVVNQEGESSSPIGTILVYALSVVLRVGIPIRTTMDNATTVQYAGLVHQLTAKARITVRDLDPQNHLKFLRIRTTKHEIMIAPGGYSSSILAKLSILV